MRRTTLILPLIAAVAVGGSAVGGNVIGGVDSVSVDHSHMNHSFGQEVTAPEAGGPPSNDDIVEGGPPADRFPVSEARGRRVGVDNPKPRNSTQKPGGCSKHYGDEGQCLPERGPGNKNWSCADVRGYFAEGVVLSRGKADPFKLDTNRDGIACGPHD